MRKSFLYLLVSTTIALVRCQESSDNLGESLPLEQFSSLQSIKNYLSANVASTGYGGKPYCAYEVLDAQQENENLNIYLWAVCHEYYLEKQKLRQGTGAVLPVALVMQKNGNDFNVVSHRVPRDGAFYGEDMPVIFSKRFLTKERAETTTDRNNRVNKLTGEIKRDAGVN